MLIYLTNEEHQTRYISNILSNNYLPATPSAGKFRKLEAFPEGSEMLVSVATLAFEECKGETSPERERCLVALVASNVGESARGRHEISVLKRHYFAKVLAFDRIEILLLLLCIAVLFVIRGGFNSRCSPST